MEDPPISVKYKDYYFIVEFPTCNSFRQILEFLNHNHKIVPLIFSEKKFSIRKPNDKGTILFDGVINTYNLTSYYINPEILRKIDDDDEDAEPEFFIHVSINSLLGNIKKAQKKQKIRIFQRRGEESFITIHTEDSSKIRIEPSKEHPIDIRLHEELPVDAPNITVQLSGFQFSATGCGRISDRISKLRAFPNGIMILSKSAQGDSIVERGDCSGEYICEIVLSGDVMKSISKLSSLCDEGIVRIYCNNDTYIRLEIPISVIGTAYIYLMTKDFSE